MSDSAGSDSVARTHVPAVDGWFSLGEAPSLIGSRCTRCGTVFFPRESLYCRNPACDGDQFEPAELSRRGRIWSYTDARYQPPPPYVVPGAEFDPFAIAAVELADEQMVVLGQVARGYGADALAVGQEVELVVEQLYADDEHEYMVWKWKPVEVAP